MNIIEPSDLNHTRALVIFLLVFGVFESWLFSVLMRNLIGG